MEENKLKNAPKGKERRQPISQDGLPKRSHKPGLIKKDLSQLPPPPPHDAGSPVKKILSEANKIVKLGMEKDYALLERDKTLQNSNEMVDNLRKNILHLQMEYEKLDQNYQREISHRSEMIKRLDATREMVESVTECSNSLSKSLKQLEADKLKIAEFYELIYQNQKEVEAKYLEVEKFIKEQDELLKTNMENVKKSQEKILSQHAETVSQLNKKFSYASDRLKVALNENEKLQKSIQECQESSQKLEACLDQQQKLNCEYEENVARFKFSLRKARIQRIKYQKLFRHKKMQVAGVFRRNKILKRSLKDAKTLHMQCVSVNKALESKNCEWERKFEKHLEEDESTLLNCEAEKRELAEKVFGQETEIESLKAESEKLKEKFLEVSRCEKSKQAELDQIQNELSSMLRENLKLKDDVVKLTEENNNKSELILNLERKASSSDADFNSRIEFQRKESEKLQDLVRKLESQVKDLEKSLAFEKEQKESTISDFGSKLEESLKMSNQKINELEKLLEERTARTEKLEFEKNQTSLEGRKALEKLTDQLQSEKSKNQELTKNFESLKESHEDVKKQLEKAQTQISDFLEKLADVNSLNKTLRSSRNDLETTAADLKRQIELKKKSFQALEEKHKKAEKELSKMEKKAEENGALKASVADLKNLLEAAEARVEAYKVVVKKLESEKVEARSIRSEEVSRPKSELVRPEEGARGGKDAAKVLVETSKQNLEHMVGKRMLSRNRKHICSFRQNKREADASQARMKEKTDGSSSHKLNTKENEPEIAEMEKWHRTSTPPLQGSKKFLSTPRKTFTSTPLSSFRSLTPAQKRDPYEFDSDGSVEQFDPDKVTKVFNRQKRETNKRSKKE